MTLNEIREMIENAGLEDRYDYIGIRTQEQPFELGRIDHLSKVWVDGEETDEELNGISVTGINSRAVEWHMDGTYYGDHVAIICGNRAEYGEDEGEIVIEDAIVEIVIR